MGGRLNFWNIPKLWLQLLIPIILALTGHWFLVVLNIPICIWLIRKFHFISKGNNAGQLKRHMMFVCIHLGWQMVSFFLFLYCLLDSVMQEQVVIPMDDDVTVLNRPV